MGCIRPLPWRERDKISHVSDRYAASTFKFTCITTGIGDCHDRRHRHLRYAAAWLRSP